MPIEVVRARDVIMAGKRKDKGYADGESSDSEAMEI